MKDKIALVTGGSGGIGTAIAQALCRQGARVGVSYNKGKQHEIAQAWQAEQKNLGFDIEIIYGDITDFESAAMIIFEIEKKLGPVDILVNNAGITDDVTLKKMSPRQWGNVIDTNLTGMFNITRNTINQMIEKQYGRIINIASINGQKGQFGQVNYCASKAGMHGFTMALAQEVAKNNITVNTLSPGYVKTKMVEKIPEKILEKIIAQIPMGRLLEPSEVANAVVFLASDQAGFMTGANLPLNGGQFMH